MGRKTQDEMLLKPLVRGEEKGERDYGVYEPLPFTPSPYGVFSAPSTTATTKLVRSVAGVHSDISIRGHFKRGPQRLCGSVGLCEPWLISSVVLGGATRKETYRTSLGSFLCGMSPCDRLPQCHAQGSPRLTPTHRDIAVRAGVVY
jgi:hypothetical protein